MAEDKGTDTQFNESEDGFVVEDVAPFIPSIEFATYDFKEGDEPSKHNDGDATGYSYQFNQGYVFNTVSDSQIQEREDRKVSNMGDPFVFPDKHDIYFFVEVIIDANNFLINSATFTGVEDPYKLITDFPHIIFDQYDSDVTEFTGYYPILRMLDGDMEECTQRSNIILSDRQFQQKGISVYGDSAHVLKDENRKDERFPVRVRAVQAGSGITVQENGDYITIHRDTGEGSYPQWSGEDCQSSPAANDWTAYVVDSYKRGVTKAKFRGLDAGDGIQFDPAKANGIGSTCSVEIKTDLENCGSASWQAYKGVALGKEQFRGLNAGDRISFSADGSDCATTISCDLPDDYSTITLESYIIHKDDTDTKFGFPSANTIDFIAEDKPLLTLDGDNEEATLGEDGATCIHVKSYGQVGSLGWNSSHYGRLYAAENDGTKVIDLNADPTASSFINGPFGVGTTTPAAGTSLDVIGPLKVEDSSIATDGSVQLGNSSTQTLQVKTVDSLPSFILGAGVKRLDSSYVDVGGSAVFKAFENSAATFSSVKPTIYGPSSPATGSAILGGSGNYISGNYNVIVAGAENSISGSSMNFIGGGSGLDIFKSEFSVSVGGKNNDILESDFSVIGGGFDNLISGGSDQAYIAGGRGNKITGAFGASIGGGQNNLIHNLKSVIAGGESNTIGYKAVDGGYNFIGAGVSNTIIGGQSTIIGGNNHTVSGSRSISVGGAFQTIKGNDAVAAGNYSIVSEGHHGAFVFSDAVTAPVYSTGANTMHLSFKSGVYVTTDSGLYINGNPVLTGETPEGDTLQSVTTRGDTTTTNIISEKIVSGATGFFDLIRSEGNLKLGPAGAYIAMYDNEGNSKKLYGANVGLGYQSNAVSAMHLYLGANIDNPDVKLMRESANVLGLRNSTAAQQFNIYNEYTSSTDYERAALKWDSDVFAIDTQTGSAGGTVRALDLRTSGQSALFIDAGTQKVGIGTNVPVTELQIDTPADNLIGQGVRINRPSAGTHYHALEFSTDGTCDWSVGQNAEDSFQVYENGAAATTRFTIKEGGNVGIGTTNPTKPLDVVGTFRQWNGVGAGIEMASYGNTTTISNGWGANSMGINCGTYMQFSTYVAGWQERMRIANDGKIGIGLDNPAHTLHVSGSVAGTGVGDRITLNGTGYLLSGDSPAETQTLQDVTTNGNTTTTSIAVHGQYLSGVTGVFESVDITGAATLTVSGNVGIGTTPSARLHVKAGTSNWDGGLLLEDNTDGKASVISQEAGALNIGYAADATDPTSASSIMVLKNDGSVGIGTSAPITQLDVVGTGLFSEKVGIGLLDPDKELEVAGTIKMSTHSDALLFASPTTDKMAMGLYGGNDLLIKNAGGNTHMAILNAGQVGIGITDPSENLEVSGNVTIGQNLGGGTPDAPWLTINGYDEHGIELHSHYGTTKWRVSTEVNGPLQLYNTGSNLTQQVDIGHTSATNGGNLFAWNSDGSVLGAGRHPTLPILDIGIQNSPASHRGDAYIDVRDDVNAPSRFHFIRGGEFITSGVSVSGSVAGTGIGGRITLNGTGYLLSGDSPAETQTLQDVTTNGNTTTNSIIVDEKISGVSGLFSSRVGIGTADPEATLQVGTHSNTMPSDTALFLGVNDLRFSTTNDNADYGSYLKPSYDAGPTPDVSILTLGTRFTTTDTDVLTLYGSNVGIGTTAPNSALEVRGGDLDIGTNDLKGAANCKIEMDAANGFKLTNPNNAHGIDFYADDLTLLGGALGYRKITTDAGDLSIDPVADLLLKENGGNVGIGITDPSENLEVSGNVVIGKSTDGLSNDTSWLSLDGYYEHGLVIKGYGNWTQWRISSKVNGGLEIYNTGASDYNQQVHIGHTEASENANVFVWTTGSVLRAGRNSTTYPILDLGIQDAAHGYNGDAYIDVRTNTAPPSRFHFKKDGEFIASGVSVSGDVAGTGSAGRITLNGTPYLLSGDSPAETQTLQDVTTNGNTTTNSIIVDEKISGVSGLFGDAVGIGTVSPSKELQVVGNVDADRYYVGTNTYFGSAGTNHGLISVEATSYGLSVYCNNDDLNINTSDNAGLGFSNGHSANYNTVDTRLFRDSAGVLGLGTSFGSAANGTLTVGDVGIGTNAPAEKLEIMSGCLSITSGLSSNIYLNSDTNNAGEHEIKYGFYANKSYPVSIVGKATAGYCRGTLQIRVSKTLSDGVSATSADTVAEFKSGEVVTYQKLSVHDDLIEMGDNYNAGAKAFKFTRSENKAAIWSVPVGGYGNADMRFTVGNQNTSAKKTEADATVRIAPDGGVAIGNSYLGESVDSGRLIVEDRVGIGTAAPANRFHLYDGTAVDAFKVENYNRGAVWNSLGGGGMYSEYQLVGAAKFRMGQANHLVTSESASNFALQYAGDLIFAYGVTEAMRMDHAGRIGIGTNNPTELLHVSGGILLAEKNDAASTWHNIIVADNSASGVGTLAGIGFNAQGWTNDIAKAGIFQKREGSYGRGSLYFVNNNDSTWTSATEADAAITIDPDGRVGIGTTDPEVALHVSGDGIKLQSTATNANNAVIELGTAGANSSPVFSMGSAGAPTEFKIMDLGYWRMATTASKSLSLGTNTTDALFIDASQNVGIGTGRSPAASFDVDGTTRIRSNSNRNDWIQWQGIHSDGRMRLRDNNDNNIYQLQTSSNIQCFGEGQGTGSYGLANWAFMAYQGYATAAGLNIGSSNGTSNTHKSLAISTPQCRASNGVSPPSDDYINLDTYSIAGNTHAGERPAIRMGASGFDFYANTDTNGFAGSPQFSINQEGYSYFTGKVGIGLTNPVHTLHVSGSVAGTGVAGRITLNGTGYLLSGDSPAETQTLQDVTTNGNSTTTSVFVEGQYLSGVTGLFSDELTVANGDITISDTSKKLRVGNTFYKNGAIEGNGNDIRIAAGGTKSLILHGGDELGIQIIDGGNVGIGITNPTSKLEVDGEVTFSGVVQSYAKFYESSSDYPTSATVFALTDYYNSAEWGMFVQNAGLLCIAQSGSLNRLQFDTNHITVTGYNLKFDSIQSTTSPAINLRGAENGDEVGIYSPATNKFSIVTDRLDRVAVDAVGNVGVGTTNPTKLLDVDGHMVAERYYAGLYNYISSTSAHALINCGANGYGLAFYAAGGDFNINTQAGGGLGFSNGHGGNYNTPDIRLRRDNTGILGIRDNTNAQELRVYSDLGDPDGDYERGSFAMDTNGNLTIGTEAGGVGTTGDLLLQPSVGNVGIGTTNPSTELHVEGDIRVGGATSLLDMDAGAKIVGQYYGNGEAELTFLKMYNPSDASINMGTKHALGYISFAAGNGAYTERMRINNAGYVGIGTTSPSAILDISSSAPKIRLTDTDGVWSEIDGNNGQLTFSADGAGSLGGTQIDFNVDGSNKMRITTDGYVGIGTSSPSYELDVNGTTRSTYYIGGAYLEENVSSSKLKFYTDGTVLVMDENGSLKPCEKENDTLVFGVSKKDFDQPVVLGAEPVLVTGPIKIGDYIVTSSKQGHGQAMKEERLGTVIAQAMEKGDGGSHHIKAMVRKM